MRKDIFLKATRFEDALNRLQKSTKAIDESEKATLKDCLNRILSRDIRSPINVPHFERSSRDGYALRSSDTFGAEEDKPVLLRLAGEVHIGTKPTIVLSEGECARISTGAMIPRAADSIAMIEHTEEVDGQVKVYRPTSPGENIIKVGTDIRVGYIVLERERKLSAFDSGVLASLGLSEVDVYRRPRVTIMSTGNELLAAGQRLEPGRIYDINSVTIHQAVVESGAIPRELGIIADEFKLMVKTLKSALSSSDIVLVSGGTSKGPGDLMPTVIEELGKPELLIHGIAMKPGKPTILSSIKSKLLITLPGYPTSALIVYYTLVDPSIAKMAHEPPHRFQRLRAYTSSKVYSEIGRREFKPCKISRGEGGRMEVVPMPSGSEAITTLANSDGFMIISEDTEFISENQEVEVYIFPHRVNEIRRLEGVQL